MDSLNDFYTSFKGFIIRFEEKFVRKVNVLYKNTIAFIFTLSLIIVILIFLFINYTERMLVGFVLFLLISLTCVSIAKS